MGHLKALKKKMQQNKLEPVARSGNNVNTRIPKENELKMSDVLFDFVGPLLDMAQTELEEKKYMQIGVLCWNLSYMPADKMQGHLDDFMKMSPPDIEGKIWFRLTCEGLIKKRQTAFSNIKRYIANMTFISHPETGELGIKVISVPLNEDDLKESKPDTESQSQ